MTRHANGMKPKLHRSFASKYLLYLPTQEQLRAEIERQKSIFFLKQNESGKQIVDE